MPLGLGSQRMKRHHGLSGTRFPVFHDETYAMFVIPSSCPIVYSLFEVFQFFNHIYVSERVSPLARYRMKRGPGRSADTAAMRKRNAECCLAERSCTSYILVGFTCVESRHSKAARARFNSGVTQMRTEFLYLISSRRILLRRSI